MILKGKTTTESPKFELRYYDIHASFNCHSVVCAVWTDIRIKLHKCSSLRLFKHCSLGLL